MDKGRISYAGKNVETVLSGLIGGEDRIEKMTTFLSLPVEHATYKFAYQCMFPPMTAEYKANDPQNEQIIESIKNFKGDDKQFRILDFGAGKGRLASAIYDSELGEKGDVQNWLDYYAYDIYADKENADLCTKAIGRIYGPDNARYFNDRDRILSSIDHSSVDLIIMCNVLHEISPHEWLQKFSKDDVILRLLKDNGYLLIVEDQLLAAGEKAHRHGYLVLSDLHLQALFNIKEEDRKSGKFIINETREGRLTAHRIHKRLVAQITRGTRDAAINELKSTARDKIVKLRHDAPSFKKGKELAFWMQQYVNSDIILGELGAT